ncbi:hypothetical protein EG831_02065 [bacterium]|nr:hypothetical protein [bacterium]
MKPVIRAALVLALLSPGRQALASKYAGEFTYLGLGARALAMGGAYVALADDGFASYWNPAGTAGGAHQAAFMHSSTFGGLVSYDAAGYTRPLRNGGCGIVLFRLGVTDVPLTGDALLDANGNGEMDPGERLDYARIGYTSDNEWFLLANYSRRLPGGLDAGGNLKLVYKTVGPGSAWGVGLDAGALRPLGRGITAGLHVADLTTTYLAWNTGQRELITPTARVGLSWRPHLGGRAPFTAAAAADVRFEGRAVAAQFHAGRMSADLHLGAEYRIRDRLSLRLGTDQGRFAAGAGLRLGRITADYAFMAGGDLGGSTRVSGGWRF